MAVFPLLDVLFAAASSPADTTDSMIEAPNRWKKWVLVSPSSPPRPSRSAPGDPMSMETPSGVRTRAQITKARDCPLATPLLYWPISLEPLGISTVEPSKPRTSRLTTARAKPGRSELIAVSRIAGITVPCGAIRALSRRRVAWTDSTPEPATFSAKRSSAESFASEAAIGARALGPVAATVL